MRAMKVFVKVALQLHPFLTATLDEGEREFHAPAPLPAVRTEWKAGGLQGWDGNFAKEKTLLPQSNHSFGASRSWTSYYIDWAIHVLVTNNNNIVVIFYEWLEIT
jgi:hypothetical protein